MHLFKPGLGSMRKGIQFLEEGMPYQIQAVHVLNAGVIFSYILGETLACNFDFDNFLWNFSNRQTFGTI